MHDVLFKLMTWIRNQSAGPFSLFRIDEKLLTDSLENIIKEKTDLAIKEGTPYPELWLAQTRQMHDQLKKYLLDQRQKTENVTHLCFELGFGMDDEHCDEMDEFSTEEPISLNTPAGVVRIRGRIDRLDRMETKEQKGLFVVDYKSGRLPENKDNDHKAKY